MGLRGMGIKCKDRLIRLLGMGIRILGILMIYLGLVMLLLGYLIKLEEIKITIMGI